MKRMKDKGDGIIRNVFDYFQEFFVICFQAGAKRIRLSWIHREIFSISARPCTALVCRCAKRHRYRQRRNLHRDIEYRLRNSSQCNATSSLRLQNRSRVVNSQTVGSNYCYITVMYITLRARTSF